MTAAGPRTTGPHFFVGPGQLDGDVAVLRGTEGRHLAVVLRARPGDPVSLADGSGRLYQAAVTQVAGDDVRLRIVALHDVPPLLPPLAVVHGLPKGRKLDDVIQRLTELGVDRIAPVHSRRGQARLSGDRAARAGARWRAIALAAAKQSRRAHLPQIEDVGEWTDAFSAGTRGVVLWEASTRPLAGALTAALAGAGNDTELVLAVGPEGGLTEEEVRACGLVDASLGATVLRTETAALVAAAAAAYHLGRLG
jgi:16S rRNA (uracil1498-N3)-methyltransferase